jgi:hypothetical protein
VLWAALDIWSEVGAGLAPAFWRSCESQPEAYDFVEKQMDR